MEDDINVIKSLIAISKGGLAVSDIPGQFREMNGTSLNFRKYGFSSVEEMLRSCREIYLWQSANGLMCRVNDEKMSHVTDLVNRTTSSKERGRKKKRSNPRYFNPPRRYPSSPKPRLNVRRGSFNDQNRRQPFHPANRKQFDSGFRNTASSRPQEANTFKNNRHESSYSSSTSYRHAFNSNSERSIRSEPKPVQSSSIGSSVNKHQLKTKCDTSSDGWSSDSSEHKQQPTLVSSVGWTSRPAEAKALAGVKLVKSSSKPQAVLSHSNDLKCTPEIHRTNSPSDWSDSESASSLTEAPKRIVVPSNIKISSIPLQNGAISSTTKRNVNVSQLSKLPGLGKPQLKPKSDSNSDWSTDSEQMNVLPSSSCYRKESSSQRLEPLQPVQPVHFSPPLMVGGIGRGKTRPQVYPLKPGMNKAQPPPNHEIEVSGSPCKHVTLTRKNDGLSTIVVKVWNEPPIRIQKTKDVVMQKTVSNYQFIGDFLLRRVAEVSLGLKFPVTGLCRNHLTILDCLQDIRLLRNSRPIVLMLGMTDILEGASFEDLKEHTMLLLQKLGARNIVLLTLPVPPSFIKIGFERKLCILEKYNKWLLSLRLPTTIEIERHLYNEAQFYTRHRCGVETFSEAGCWVVLDEIICASN